MTELATPPTEQQQGMTRIHHWIGGKPVEGASGRTGPVFNPALGQQSGQVDLATAEEVGAAVAAAKAAFPAWRRPRSRSAQRSSSDPRARPSAARRWRRILTAEHGKVLSDAMGEVTPELEVIEFACGIPHSAQGRHVRAGLDRGRHLLDPAAARRRRRDHAVQLPRHGPMWMWAPALACGNTFVLKPSEKDPSASVWTASCSRRPVCPTASSTSSTATRWRSTRSSSTRRRRGELRRLDADRAVRLRDRDEARQARAGARRGEEPHDRPPRRGHRPGRRRCGQRRLRLGRRALHGDLAGGHGRRRGRRARRRDQAAAAEDQGRQRPRRGRMGRSSPASTATGSPRTSRAAPSRARPSSSTAARPRPRATASSSA